jgi:DNA-binding MarR family transcriptional regulator
VDTAAAIGARTPAGDAFSELVIRVFQLNGLLADAGDALTRPVGQTTARWQVMASVEHAPMSVAAIARTLGLARQSVQRVADALEAGGLLAYQPNPRHRRAQLAMLTEEGRAALERIQAAQRPWADEVGRVVGERQLRQATALLDRLLAALARAQPA